MIDPDLAGFLHEGLGIHLGTRDRQLHPNGVRAIAARVGADGTHITVFLAENASVRVLPDLRSNGHGAVSFGRPIDERACQVKGTFVEARPARDEERGMVLAQFEGYKRNLEMIGVPRNGMEQWTTWPAIAITLKVTAVFEQTPRPGTGEQIR